MNDIKIGQTYSAPNVFEHEFKIKCFFKNAGRNNEEYVTLEFEGGNEIDLPVTLVKDITLNKGE